MANITSASKLVFFKAEKYRYNRKHIFDTSNCPRPHFCMGLILEGEGTFWDCEADEYIHVVPGDIIFVPITSRYISEWKGNPEVSYISMHFIFDWPAIFSRHRDFLLQKVTVEDAEHVRQIFEYVLANYDQDEVSQLTVLSKFYDILSVILPKLQTRQRKEIDARISKAIAYMEKHYTDDISIENLADISTMSVSRFFPNFKKAMGVTAIEYLNHYRVSKAIILLMNDSDLSIENISEQVGFESAAYFRRVFKKVTGKSPREYRKTSMEL